MTKKQNRRNLHFYLSILCFGFCFNSFSVRRFAFHIDGTNGSSFSFLHCCGRTKQHHTQLTVKHLTWTPTTQTTMWGNDMLTLVIQLIQRNKLRARAFSFDQYVDF